MIINKESREECLIKKSISTLNTLTGCKNITKKRKTYKSLLRIFSNNPDIFRYLKKSIFDSYSESFNDIDKNSLYPSTMVSMIMITILYGKDIDIDIKGVTESEVRNFLSFVMVIHLVYASAPMFTYNGKLLNGRELNVKEVFCDESNFEM